MRRSRLEHDSANWRGGTSGPGVLATVLSTTSVALQTTPTALLELRHIRGVLPATKLQSAWPSTASTSVAQESVSDSRSTHTSGEGPACSQSGYAPDITQLAYPGGLRCAQLPDDDAHGIDVHFLGEGFAAQELRRLQGRSGLMWQFHSRSRPVYTVRPVVRAAVYEGRANGRFNG